MSFINKHIDKVAHLLAGYLVFDVFNTFMGLTAGFFFVFFFAIVKEIVDEIIGGTSSAWDVVVTIVGGFLGWSVYLIK
jgi:hypothetical protein